MDAALIEPPQAATAPPRPPPAPIDAAMPGKIARVFFDRQTGHYRPSRYKVLHGGRGGGKSDSVARVIPLLMREAPIRVLCTRRYQNSIEDSVHRTLGDAIGALGLADEFSIQKRSIVHKATGSDVLFKGTARSIGEIKSTKGIKICWIEEAETFPKDDWDILDPTIREDNSEIWLTYNPDLENGAIHQMFAVRHKPGSIVAEVNWRDNPWFPPALGALRQAAEREALTGDASAQAAYDWIWEGKCRRITDAVVFRDRVSIEDFDEPGDARPFYGADWGFADDPTVLIRSYVDEASNTLYITHEAFGWHVELDDIGAQIFDTVPGSRDWPIKGDAAQPMIISYLARQGYPISAADKWAGSVEDGIAHLKGFKRIIVHPRCKHIAQEFRLYSWKTDPRQLDAKGNPVILPILIDRWNHGLDSLRYSLDGYIRQRGMGAVWEKL